MGLTVNDRARMLATFRFIEVRLMEIVAAWTPTTPEMEVKVMFGRHIWDLAQHADMLGKRTFELRQSEHFTLRPTDEYAGLIEDVARETDTTARLAALYEAVLPGVERRYRLYLGATDALLDQPSVVIVNRILADLERMRREASAVRAHVQPKSFAVEPLRARENAVARIFV